MNAACIETIQDIKKFVFNKIDPAFTAIYQPIDREAETSVYEITPLACFYPRSEAREPHHVPRHFLFGQEDYERKTNPRKSQKSASVDFNSSSTLSLESTTTESSPKKLKLSSSPVFEPNSFYPPEVDEHKTDQDCLSHIQSPTSTLSDTSALVSERSVENCAYPLMDFQRIPIEVFELIAQNLSCSDVRNMRLVNRACERAVAAHLFETVVAPFNAEIYGLLLLQEQRMNAERLPFSSKGKARADSPLHGQILEKLNKRQRQSLDVFRGFGHHIRRFGIRFEVKEHELASSRSKEVQGNELGFWGDYSWPFQDYSRFEDREGLETTADETTTMRTAFQHLDGVQHLALSLNSGLGWISGPDLSIRSRVLQESTNPFEAHTKHLSNTKLDNCRRFWTLLRESYVKARRLSALKVAEFVRLEDLGAPTYLLNKTQSTSFRIDGQLVDEADTNRKQTNSFEVNVDKNEPRPRKNRLARPEKTTWGSSTAESSQSSSPDSTLFASNPTDELAFVQALSIGQAEKKPSNNAAKSTSRRGILFTRPIPKDEAGSKFNKGGILPNFLSQAQREWLMETSWAQDAFLSSYVVSITDNSKAFCSVQTLTLAPFSSCYLHKLFREDFWDALPGLSTLELLVNPDWRQIDRDEAGQPTTSYVPPTACIDTYFNLLTITVAPRDNIKTLKVGWATGGEHAEGLTARNRHVMPAPLSNRQSCLPPSDFGLQVLQLPHVERFRLVNCWVASNVFQDWVRRHVRLELRQLTLESVSLNEQTRHAGAGHAAGGALGAINQLTGQIAQQLQPGQLQLFQQQLQQHMQQNQHGLFTGGPFVVQNQGVGAGPASNSIINQVPPGQIAGAAPAQQASPAQSREGQWAEVLRRFQSIVSAIGKTDLEVRLISCGLATLPRRNVAGQYDVDDYDDQIIVDGPASEHHRLVGWFHHRRALLRAVMMVPNDDLLGSICTRVLKTEMSELEDKWHLTQGWPTEDLIGEGLTNENEWAKWGRKNVEAAEFDGRAPGGTGRISGLISFKIGQGSKEED